MGEVKIAANLLPCPVLGDCRLAQILLLSLDLGSQIAANLLLHDGLATTDFHKFTAVPWAGVAQIAAKVLPYPGWGDCRLPQIYCGILPWEPADFLKFVGILCAGGLQSATNLLPNLGLGSHVCRKCSAIQLAGTLQIVTNLLPYPVLEDWLRHKFNAIP